MWVGPGQGLHAVAEWVEAVLPSPQPRNISIPGSRAVDILVKAPSLTLAQHTIQVPSRCFDLLLLITMRDVPLDVLLAWPRPNYVDPSTRGPTLMIVELTLLPIAMLVVFLRMWIRISWLHKSWWDDYLMVAGPRKLLHRTGRVAVLTWRSSSQWAPPSWSSWQHNSTAGISMSGILPLLKCRLVER